MINIIMNISALMFVVLGISLNIIAWMGLLKKKEKRVVPVQKSKFQRSLTPELIQRLNEIQGVYH